MKRSTFTRTARLATLAVAAAALGALAVLANTDHTNPKAAVSRPQAGPASAPSQPQVLSVVLAAKTGKNDPDKAVDKTGGNGHRSFSIVGAVTDLYPGAQKQLALTVTNPDNQDLKVTSLKVTVQDSNQPGCAAANLVATDFSGSFVVKKHQSVTRQLPLRMVASPAASCQGATFPLQYEGTAVKA
jgi:hypothetical protein